MLPEFIIIGAQKSGTTYIQQCLREHPEIYLPNDEVSYFETPDYETSNRKDLEKYFDSNSDKVKGIKRPNYLGLPEVPKRIKEELPDIKLIAILRDPIERAISAYYHKMKYGLIPLEPIEEGMSKILNGKYQNTYRSSGDIIEFGFYYKYLKMYNYYLKNERILILKFSDLFYKKNGKIDGLKKILEYLNVNTEWAPEDIDKRPQRVVYNLKRLKFLRSLNNNKYLYYYDNSKLKPKEKKFGDKIKIKSYNVIDKLFLNILFSNKKPCISKEVYGRLKNIYKRDVDMLKDYIDLEVTNWLDYDKYMEKYS